MKLAALIFAMALTGVTALAGAAIEPPRTLRGEMARHEQVLLEIQEAEIDAKAAFEKETLHCNSNSACLAKARASYKAARKAIQARRIDEDALHAKNMKKVEPVPPPPARRSGGCM